MLFLYSLFRMVHAGTCPSIPYWYLRIQKARCWRRLWGSCWGGAVFTLPINVTLILVSWVDETWTLLFCAPVVLPPRSRHSNVGNPASFGASAKGQNMTPRSEKHALSGVWFLTLEFGGRGRGQGDRAEEEVSYFAHWRYFGCLRLQGWKSLATLQIHAQVEVKFPRKIWNSCVKHSKLS